MLNLPRPVARILVIALKLGAVVVVAALIYYQMALSPVVVEAAKADRGTVVEEVMGTGTLEPRVRVSVSPKITGLLTKVLVDQNDRVSSGQLLAELDDRELKQQVEVAKADLEAIRAGLERMDAEITRSQSTLQLSRIEHDRMTELLPTKAVSQYDLDKAIQQLGVAEAELRRAQSGKAELQRQVIKAEASIQYYSERLADTRILSPFAGLVVRRAREQGDVVVPGGTILELISTEQLWLSAFVDESAVPTVKADQPARIVFRAEPGKAYRGSVTRLSPQIDRETREFLVDVTAEELPAAWAIGQRAEVFIETARKEAAVVLPQRFVVWREGKPGVTIDDAGKARWKPVTIGLRGREVIEIKEGLVAGQIAILPKTTGDGLRDGRAVRVDHP